MTRLSYLISEAMRKGKTYRCISEESGINHVSIREYHLHLSEPAVKNLHVLGAYFHVDPHDLLIDMDSFDKKYTSSPSCSVHDPDLQRIVDAWPSVELPEKMAIMCILDAFSKEASNSLKTNVRAA